MEHKKLAPCKLGHAKKKRPDPWSSQTRSGVKRAKLRNAATKQPSRRKPASQKKKKIIRSRQAAKQASGPEAAKQA